MENIGQRERQSKVTTALLSRVKHSSERDPGERERRERSESLLNKDNHYVKLGIYHYVKFGI